MTKSISTTQVSKNEYIDYLEKGRQFFSAMSMCLEDKEWDAVLLNGTHAVISTNDALCVYKLGKRSSSKIHQDAMTLLEKACPGEEGKKNSRRLSEILNLKHQVEYEPKRFTEKEARDFVVKVERFVSWAKSQLP